MTKREKLIEIIDAGDPNAKPPEAILDALLAELREPDEEMLNECGDHNHIRGAQRFQAMIDAVK